MQPGLVTTLVLTMVTDIIVATTMTYYLRRKRSPIQRFALKIASETSALTSILISQNTRDYQLAGAIFR